MDCDLPKSWDFWSDQDTSMLRLCARLKVLRLKGWDASEGVRAELAMATAFGMPVGFIDP